MENICLKLRVFILCIIALYTQNLHGLVRLNPYRHNLFELNKEPPLNVNTRASTAAVEELWLEQKVNHFDARNQRTWKMRYLRNSQYFRPNGPIYILVGGEWTISKPWLSQGLIHDMAVEMGGMLYYTEHRYYGKSWPVINSTISNLRYLSVRQALADLAHFIHVMRSEDLLLKNAKIILVGGSYAGSMVTWVNRLYPYLITASWASSAPLKAKADFYEYMEVVADSITNAYGQNCSERIERGMAALATSIKDFNISKKVLKRLNACDNFNIHNEYDLAALFNGIGNYFAYIVQSYSSHIPQLCKHLMSLQPNIADDRDDDDEEALILYLSLLFGLDNNIRSEEGCQDFSYQNMLQVFTDIQEQTSGTRQWFYQTCQEFGWYTITAREPKQITNIEDAADGGDRISFGSQVPLRYFERLCLDAFANGNESLSSSSSTSSSSSSSTSLSSSSSVYTLANMSLGISQTNALFGNNSNSNTTNRNRNRSTKNVTSYENVFFTHGQLDPWRALGQQSGRNALVIPGYSHCADLGSIDIQDSDSMNSAKLRVMSFLRRHLT